MEFEGHAVTGAGDPADIDAIRAFAVAALRREQNADLAAFGEVDLEGVPNAAPAGFHDAVDLHRTSEGPKGVFMQPGMEIFFRRLGVKWMLLVGMGAWVLRYALFALGYQRGTVDIDLSSDDRFHELIGKSVRMREIFARIERKGCKPVTVRLWTSLLEPELYPAHELVMLYARRWEHEVYYREMKIEMRGGSLLHSHTPQTAAQEIAALVRDTGGYLVALKWSMKGLYGIDPGEVEKALALVLGHRRSVWLRD